MKRVLKFEICASNIQSALAAAEAGAQRIELCSALDVGGITPSPGLIRKTLEAINIPVNVLIRPREGNFCYTEQELDIMLGDIVFCREAGVNGVVVGALDTHQQLDLNKLQAMQEAAGSMEVVHHRAFDFCNDPFKALQQLIDLGYHRILSSGQANSAFEGRFLLKKLVEAAAGRISIMPGAGINAMNIQAIASVSGAAEFHFTGKIKVQEEQTNAIDGLSTWFWQSDVETIREVMEAVG